MVTLYNSCNHLTIKQVTLVTLVTLFFNICESNILFIYTYIFMKNIPL